MTVIVAAGSASAGMMRSQRRACSASGPAQAPIRSGRSRTSQRARGNAVPAWCSRRGRRPASGGRGLGWRGRARQLVGDERLLLEQLLDQALELGAAAAQDLGCAVVSLVD